MCFKAKIPQPKPAPEPPDKNLANFDAAQEQRAALSSSYGRRQTILTRLSDDAVAASGQKKKLGAG